MLKATVSNVKNNSDLQVVMKQITNTDIYKIQFPINPYGKANKMAEDIILDFSKTSDMAVMILRFVMCFSALPHRWSYFTNQEREKGKWGGIKNFI